ncbi:MAG: ComEC/Rec2 family competence protein [Elusimicrobiales bacterium]|nr:ComEC/Rec2 family competence protein [Elusimicrobiales bacterium]
MNPDVYKRPLLWVLAAYILTLVFCYSPAPAKRDVFHSVSPQPVTLTGRVDGFAVSKKGGRNAAVKVTSVNGAPAEGTVYARFKNFEPEWKDEIQISGKLQKPYGINLLGNFDWRDYLALKNIFTEIKASDAAVIKPAPFFIRWIRRARTAVLRSFDDSFPPELAGIAGGVTLGERGEFPQDLYGAFQDSGAIHLLVASGGNVGFVTLIVLFICSFAGLGRRKMMFAALAAAGVYTLVAGADAPLVRAYFMTICACAGYLLGRNSGVFQGLLVSCFVILCFHPAAVFETGFQMSFLATLAIIICLNNYSPPANWPKWLTFFVQIFLATLSTQLVLLPVFTNVFYKVSVTGLASNMVLVPLASCVMGLGFAYSALYALHAGSVLYWPLYGALWLFKTLVEFFASFKMSALPASSWGMGTVAAYYAGLFLLFNLPLKNFARKIAPACFAFMVLALAVQYVARPKAEVYLLNEWNRSSAVVRLRGGETLVLGDGIKEEKMLPALYKTGVRRADVFLPFSAEADYAWERLADKTVLPFKDVWPGEFVDASRARVRMAWGLHETKDGRLWENKGYSGTKKDDVSYCFETSGGEWCIGAQARFLRKADGTVVRGRLNDTVKIKL